MTPWLDLEQIHAAVLELEPWPVCHVQYRFQDMDGWTKSEHRTFVGPADAKVADDQWGPWKVP